MTTTIDSKQFSAIEPQLLRVEEVVWPAPPGYRCVENENAQSPGRPRIKLRQELPEWKPLLHDLADFGRENPALSVGIIHHISSPLCTPEFPELLQEAWTRTNCRENAPQTAYNAALATWALLADWSLK